MKNLKEEIINKIKKDKKQLKIYRIIQFSIFTFIFTLLLSLNLSLSTSLFFGSLISALMLFIVGSKWYYDEFEIKRTVNGVDKLSTKSIKILQINKIEDIGDDKYKINVTNYQLTGVPGTENIIVDKWKVRIDVRWDF